MLQPRKGSSRRLKRTPITPENPNLCVALARVSTDRQQNSVENQQIQLRRHAKSKGLTIAKTFIDENISAVSTKFLERPGVKKMLRYMKRHHITTILMQRPDRGFRKLLDLAITLTELDRNGIHFRFIEPDLDLSTPAGKMLLHLMVQFAEMESTIRQQRQLEIIALTRSKRIARSQHPPYGWRTRPHPTEKYKTSGRPKLILIPDPVQQAHLREIIRLREQQKLSFNDIADTLNHRNIPSPGHGKTYTRNGKQIPCSGIWSTRGVRSVYEHRDPATEQELANTQTQH